MINIIAICSLVLVAVVAAIELYIRRRYNGPFEFQKLQTPV